MKCNRIGAKDQIRQEMYITMAYTSPVFLLIFMAGQFSLFVSGQADIRNPLRYLLITECCFAAYQEWLAPLLIQASPDPLLIALCN